MRTSRLFTVGAVLASYGWVLAGGCSASDKGSPGDGGFGASPDASVVDPDATQVKNDAMGLGGSNGMHLNPLCGDASADDQCVPDEANACADFRPPVIKPPAGSGGEGGGAEGGASGGMSVGGAGLGGEPSVGGAGEGGASAGEAGAAFGGASGGQGGSGGDDGGPVGAARYGCQIGRVGNLPQRSCQLAGEGDINAPCFSAADCQPGLGCVAQGQTGRCLRYCCEGDDTCDRGSYCTEQPLRKPSSDTSNAEPPRVPVCVPGDDCSLEEPFPCPEGTECRCNEGTACLVVRADGTTTCRAPGTGTHGEACQQGDQCAWNHVCSIVTHKCVKICNTDPAKDDCGAQKCQASSELPQNFGVCVGPVK